MVTNINKGKAAQTRAPKVFTFDVMFVLQVLAVNEKEAETICESEGGYVLSRIQKIRKEEQ